MQVERERYATTDFKRITLPELVAQFNHEHPGLNIEIPNTNSKCIIETIRSSAETEDGIIIRRDRSVVVSSGRKPMPDSIEIECRSRDRIKAAKESLRKFFDFFGFDPKTIVIKDTREDQAKRISEMPDGPAEREID